MIWTMGVRLPRRWRTPYQALLAGLKAGKTPSALGARGCGRGAFKKVWRLGDWIIKAPKNAAMRAAEAARDYPAWTEPFPPTLKRAGLTPPSRRLVHGYIVQPYYKPLTASQCDDVMVTSIGHYWYDIKPDNCGTDRRGRIVAFDW